MKKITSLFAVAIVFGSMLFSNQIQAQMPGSLVPIVLLKHATGYWGESDDADGDGVVDEKDACPNVYGTINGCPDKDTDGDGIYDSKDKCPEVAGPINGCPEKEADTDNDGVVDSKDKCPEVYGTINGCPEKDTDGDGIVDSKDDCPEVKGTKEANGCLLSKEEKRVIKEASAHIYFETGSSKIKAESFPDLDKLTAILKKHPEVKAKVEGYTDNTGNAQKNLSLSKARAASVKQYLIQHGEKEDHVSSEGYGINNPIATNDTKEGRAKNRRVEIVISSFQTSK